MYGISLGTLSEGRRRTRARGVAIKARGHSFSLDAFSTFQCHCRARGVCGRNGRVYHVNDRRNPSQRGMNGAPEKCSEQVGVCDKKGARRRGISRVVKGMAGNRRKKGGGGGGRVCEGERGRSPSEKWFPAKKETPFIHVEQTGSHKEGLTTWLQEEKSEDWKESGSCCHHVSRQGANLLRRGGPPRGVGE